MNKLTTPTEANKYHYTESGLDNVYLVNGYDIIDGHQLVIEDTYGLHKAIGRILINSKKNLIGREIRFLRHEMLMSQVTLAKLLDVSEQAINRWENGKTSVPKPAEALIRLLYREHIHSNDDPDDKSTIRSRLKKIADLEDEIDQMIARKEDDWQLKAAA